ncbi:hypothetical protein MTR67_035820 [Solanum verrucosum]|uniref:Uncharacterized protein n=1 Tax=Solanum verrucosum TaxID=315347 RepID=A0AAF0UAW9_SOLVR|nr:hypothetical protein MTR67_035820 [Solanum verrucosum]
MAGTPSLTQCFVHPSVSPSSTTAPSATSDDEMPALAPGQKDRLDNFKAMSEQAKKARGSLKGGSLHTEDAKTIGTITREIVFKKTHVKKKENESDPDVWVEERAEHTFIASMSAQIAQLTSALAESKRRRVAEQQSMSATVQQIKEQVLNLAHQPTTSAPEDTNDDSEEEEEDFVDATP